MLGPLLMLHPLGLLLSLVERLLDRVAPQPKPRLGPDGGAKVLAFERPSRRGGPPAGRGYRSAATPPRPTPGRTPARRAAARPAHSQ